MASGGGGSSIIPAGSSGPSFKWLKEWYQGLPPADAEELVKNFNRGSWVTEIGNFDSKHKQHLVKLHEIAFPFTLRASSSPKPPVPEPPKKITLEQMTAGQLIDFIKEKEKETEVINSREQKLRGELASYRKEIEEYLKFI